MLRNNIRSQIVKKIHLCVDSPPLERILEALLLDWGYLLTDSSDPEGLLIISDGREAPAGFCHRLTLSHSHYQGRHNLEVPLTVENFYLALENHFHRTPRNHIRISIEWPLQLHLLTESFSTTTITVADRGVRFVSPVEFSRGEEFEVTLMGDNERFEMPVRVVYSVPGMEIGRGQRIEVGAIAMPRDPKVRDSIRSRIIGNYLKRVRPILGSNLFAEALHELNLTSMARIVAQE